jgi:hypothetical protein
MPVTSKSRSSERSGLSMSIVTHTTVATKRPGTMLTKNNQCQEKVSVKNPPRVGPKVDDRLRITEMMAMTVASCRPRNLV